MIDALRPCIRGMAGYVPGEQPREGPIIKLNTNENPYPPSPRVFAALREALTGDLLRKYPDPGGTHFRQTAGRVLGVDADSILIGNGSDDVLTILTRAFVPEGGLVVSPTPSYLLYRTLTGLQGAHFRTVPFLPDWSLLHPWPDRSAHLTFLANPNSPSGTVVPRGQIERLLQETSGPLVIDEAYADFASSNCLELARAHPGRVVLTRSFSKSYALAGIRFGFAVAEPELVRQLLKVKDSYNCDVLSLVAAAAAIEDQDYLQFTRARILATRERLRSNLGRLGFAVCPSEANFVWCRHEAHSCRGLYEELKQRHILVRIMSYDGYGDGLRITVGSDAEIDRLLDELASLV